MTTGAPPLPPCVGRAKIFFSYTGRDIAQAKALCSSCAVLDPCRNRARNLGEWGIWGGETEDDRRAAGFPPQYTSALAHLELADSTDDVEAAQAPTTQPKRRRKRRNPPEHGTMAAVRRHRYFKEDLCELCGPEAERDKEEREKNRKPRARSLNKKEPPDCGTPAKYRWHRKRKEECEECKEAERLHSQQRRDEKRTNAA
ncbi:WhiB family transcriptional regulator [Kitasatospora viridis]|uniref:Transcription factor WhiB n=1 Tax=Kitasatospora viridis TaxID=281105 RepID=A0A561SAG9_9ACTN|nr:WhiB family transcriptional regulator [Kitasatospora viridis]TWF71795.1 transcription factor WhiB [Kitasatospora viridis]